MVTDEDLKAWIAGLEELFGQVAGRFYRVEPRRRARAYVHGLLAPLAGKNGWTLAEAAGDLTPDGMPRLLHAASWDADGSRDDLRDYAVRHLGEGDGVLIVEETGLVKKGCKSAGVPRQYSGTAGRIENYQLGVFCAEATTKGRTLIDRELSLPKFGNRRSNTVPPGRHPGRERVRHQAGTCSADARPSPEGRRARRVGHRR